MEILLIAILGVVILAVIAGVSATKRSRHPGGSHRPPPQDGSGMIWYWLFGNPGDSHSAQHPPDGSTPHSHSHHSPGHDHSAHHHCGDGGSSHHGGFDGGGHSSGGDGGGCCGGHH